MKEKRRCLDVLCHLSFIKHVLMLTIKHVERHLRGKINVFPYNERFPYYFNKKIFSQSMTSLLTYFKYIDT